MTKANQLVFDELGRSFSGKSFISIHDFSPEQVKRILDLAMLLKSEQKAGIPHQILKGKTLGMIFTKPSTRTRISFEVAIWQLGGYALFLSANDLQLKRGETIADTARVLSRYLDGIMIRTFAHSDVTELAQYGSIPVVNGLTDLLHPCQIMADLLTAVERFGDLRGRKLAYVGDGNNVLHSLMFGGAKVGMSVTCVCPPGYEPDPAIVAAANEDGKATGAVMEVVHDVAAGVAGADVLYTDVWASMGQEEEHAKRVRDFQGYQLNSQVVSMASPHAIVMHCLPAHRGEEITDEVCDGPQSVLWDEAENRLHAQKAILALLMS